MIGGNGGPGAVIITYFSASGLAPVYTATAPLSMSGNALTIANATSSAPGVVQPDNTTITVNAGVLSTILGQPLYASNSTNISTTGYIQFSKIIPNASYTIASSSPYGITLPKTGYYKFEIYGLFNSNGNGNIAIYKNGTQITNLAAYPAAYSASGNAAFYYFYIFSASASDVFSVNYTQVSGGFNTPQIILTQVA
jgi:hypothetical protein